MEKLIGFLLFTLPSCLSLAIGLQLTLVLGFPSFYPLIHEMIHDLNCGCFIALNASICVVLPVILLFCITREASA